MVDMDVVLSVSVSCIPVMRASFRSEGVRYWWSRDRYSKEFPGMHVLRKDDSTD